MCMKIKYGMTIKYVKVHVFHAVDKTVSQMIAIAMQRAYELMHNLPQLDVIDHQKRQIKP